MYCCKLCHNVSVVESADQEAFIGVVQDSEHENPWITLAVNGKPLKFKIDTGADVSVIPHKLFKNIPGASLTPAKKILSGPGYKVLPVKGQFVATLQHGNKQVTEDVFIVRRLSRALLGRPAIESLDLVSRVNAVQSKKKLLCEFPKLMDLENLTESTRSSSGRMLNPMHSLPLDVLPSQCCPRSKPSWNAWKGWEW